MTECRHEINIRVNLALREGVRSRNRELDKSARTKVTDTVTDHLDGKDFENSHSGVQVNVMACIYTTSGKTYGNELSRSNYTQSSDDLHPYRDVETRFCDL